MARKITQATINNQWNENGALIERREDKTYILDDEPPYVKLYLDTILFLRSLPKGYNPVLLAFLKRMSYANQQQLVYFNTQMKLDIANELKVSKSRIDHAITDFVKGKIMLKVGTGRSSTYQLNPHLFGKGKWSEIEGIRNTIVFNAVGQTTILDSMQEQTVMRQEVNICPLCDSEMKIKNGRNGQFLGCVNFPNCKHTESVSA
jgi:hypothetical protein